MINVPDARVDKIEAAIAERAAASSAMDRGSDRDRPVRWCFLATGVVVVAWVLVILVFAVGVGFRLWSPSGQTAYADLAAVASPLFGAVACALACRRLYGSARYGWALIGAGLASWASGQLIWTYYEVIAHWLTPFPSLADAAYLLAYPLIVTGLATLITVRRHKLRILLDALIVSCSFLLVSWAFLIHPTSPAARGTTYELWLGLAYNIGDVALITMALLLFSEARPSQRGQVWLLAAGLLAWSVSDVLFTYATTYSTYVTTFPKVLIGSGWFIGFMVMGLAALSARTRLGHLEPYQERWSLVPYVALAAALIASIFLTARYGGSGRFPSLLLALIVILVATRLFVSARENLALNRQLVAQAREAGVLDERARMAREIHDTIAQGLTGIITQLEAARQGPQQRNLDAAAGLARQTLSEARRSVRNLQPEPLHGTSLPDAIADVARRWSDLNALTAEVTTTGTVRPLHPEIEGTLLRTAQEALANVAKHAAATRVGLTLSYMENQVTLDVRDDGAGFDPLAVPPPPTADGRNGAGDGHGGDGHQGGFGLVAMLQRLDRVAGRLEIESEPGGGTAVSASVPAIATGGSA